MGRSQKENEHRLALHPRHLERIPADLRQRIYLEEGYGERFGVSDDELADSSPGCAPASSSSTSATSSCSPSRCIDDVPELREGQVLWGWPHCVQDQELTQLAVDRRLTLIAFEAMNHWKPDGVVQPARVPQEQRARGLLRRCCTP